MELILRLLGLRRKCRACGLPFARGRDSFGQYCTWLCVPAVYRKALRSYGSTNEGYVDLESRVRDAGV